MTYTLSDIKLFDLLSEDERARLAPALEFVDYERGDAVFKSGDTADHFCIVMRGRMKVYFLQPNGREQILYIYGPGDFIGGLNLIRSTNFSYNAETLEDCTICWLGRDLFMQVIAGNTAMVQTIMAKLWTRLRWAEALIARLSLGNAETRIAQLLLDLVPQFGVETPAGTALHLTLTHDELGGYAGMSRETVTRQLGKLADRGFIRMQKGKEILLLKPEALRELVLSN